MATLHLKRQNGIDSYITKKKLRTKSWFSLSKSQDEFISCK